MPRPIGVISISRFTPGATMRETGRVVEIEPIR